MQQRFLGSTDRAAVRELRRWAEQHIALDLADTVAETVELACAWFDEPDHLFLGDPTAPPLDDAVVDAVCTALQAQLTKEGIARTRGAPCSRHALPHTAYYDLAGLPQPRRRALVQRLWVLKQQFGQHLPQWEADEPDGIH